MRYRLRTLMVVVTALGAFLGWVAYVRQMERYHSEQADSLIALIGEAFHVGGVRETVERMARDKNKHRILNNKTAADFQKPLRADTDAFASAIYHQRMAAIYHRAIFRPWALLSKPPLNDNQTREGNRSSGNGVHVVAGSSSQVQIRL